MSEVCVTRHVEFEMAHLLANYPGGCGNLHGHTYKLEVSIVGCRDVNTNYGFVLDFKELDKVIKSVVPDHKFVANQFAVIEEGTAENQIINVLKEHNMAYELYPFPTSAENMVGYFAQLIQEQLPDYLVTECKLWETTNSYATWFRTS